MTAFEWFGSDEEREDASRLFWLQTLLELARGDDDRRHMISDALAKRITDAVIDYRPGRGFPEGWHPVHDRRTSLNGKARRLLQDGFNDALLELFEVSLNTADKAPATVDVPAAEIERQTGLQVGSSTLRLRLRHTFPLAFGFGRIVSGHVPNLIAFACLLALDADQDREEGLRRLRACATRRVQRYSPECERLFLAEPGSRQRYCTPKCSAATRKWKSRQGATRAT